MVYASTLAIIVISKGISVMVTVFCNIFVVVNGSDFDTVTFHDNLQTYIHSWNFSCEKISC